jgi:hypothetical protein
MSRFRYGVVSAGVLGAVLAAGLASCDADSAVGPARPLAAPTAPTAPTSDLAPARPGRIDAVVGVWRGKEKVEVHTITIKADGTHRWESSYGGPGSNGVVRTVGDRRYEIVIQADGTAAPKPGAPSFTVQAELDADGEHLILLAPDPAENIVLTKIG